MKKILILVLVFIIILSSFAIYNFMKSRKIESNMSLSNKEKKEFKTLYSAEITSLNYLVSSGANEYAIIANTIDGLIEYDNFGIVRPALASSWTISEDNLVWTFNLRQGVGWYRHNGKFYDELSADDFVTAMEYILDNRNKSKTANIAYSVIKNAEKYYKGHIEDFSKVGIRAKDKYTIEYRLERPTPYFLSMLSYGCFFPLNRSFLNEMGEEFGKDNEKLLYNGAYLFDTFQPQYRRILVKNMEYWDRENVHIEKILSSYNKEAGNIGPEMFLRGEIDSAIIPSNVLKQWIDDTTRKKMVRPNRNSFFSYFYAFNFDPKFSDEFEPENWKKAVNNRNFRKALFHALDRQAAMLTSDPYDPLKRIQNTITPKYFINHKGLDYTEMGSLGGLVEMDTFNKDLAGEYKKKAKEELAGQVKFPVKVLMPYSTGSIEWANRSQIIEQQMEGVLGSDFIDIIIAPQPATGFLEKVRRSGNFAFLECNWGPDYADPETYTDPFSLPSNYNKPYLALEYLDDKGISEYSKLLDKGKKELFDLDERLINFAEAEAFLIKEALIIPYSVGGGGYLASRLNPFDASYSPFGLSGAKFKGLKVLEKPMDEDAFLEEELLWEEKRNKLLNE